MLFKTWCYYAKEKVKRDNYFLKKKMKKKIVAVKVLVGICTVGTCTKPWYDHTMQTIKVTTTKNKMNTKTPHNNTTQQQRRKHKTQLKEQQHTAHY